MSGYSPLYLRCRLYYVLLAVSGLVALAGMFAVYLMEHHGHVITGMNNQVVWGLPHVFAIFLIVAASGVLNVASIGSVFGKAMYKARAPMASLLSIAMLAGGLAVLMLDLGRPDRLIVAATNINFTSVFAWNVVLYTGMYFDIREGEPEPETREKVKKGLELMGFDEPSPLPYLLELLSVKNSGIDKIPMSPEAKKDRISEAIKRMF